MAVIAPRQTRNQRPDDSDATQGIRRIRIAAINELYKVSVERAIAAAKTAIS